MSTEEYLAVLKASYDYSPQSGDEIEVKENQLLFLLERVDEDWWKVKVKHDSSDSDSPSGLVPAAYVEPAEPTSTVQALYDYEASAPGELTIKEDEILHVFETEEEWLLVQSQAEGGKAGFVPANYVQEHTGEAATATPAPAAVPKIVVPDSPPRPYTDPADLVAASKKTTDNIETWAVTEIDKKGKKKKGTLGIGNGAVFFASESDKTPVQKWQTSTVANMTIEKSKHVRIDVGDGLHFNAGSKETAEAIITKLASSKAIATGTDSSAVEDADAAPEEAQPSRPRGKSGASVHFSEDAPAIIPSAPAPDDDDDNEEEEGMGDEKRATALYDFEAAGADELSVREGEVLVVLEATGDEWWKCRNESGQEGDVPASYLELMAPSAPEGNAPEAEEEEEEEDKEAAAREAARLEEEEKAKRQKDQFQQEQKRLEAERRERAAEAERKRAEKEREQAEAQKRKEQELERREREIERKEKEAREREAREREGKKEKDKSSSRSSGDASASKPRGPLPEKTRVWHDITGQFRVDAAFLGFKDGKLRLHKINGVVIEVPAEKMSPEDLEYVKKVTGRKSSSRHHTNGSEQRPQRSEQQRPQPSKPKPADSDDEVLGNRRRSILEGTVSPSPAASTPPPRKKGPGIDWFEFFLSAGCDIDDCTRYAASFDRDKIDEAILPDITEATMRSLGLREGDIIRVAKAIASRQPVKKNADNSAAVQAQITKDEEIAWKLQQEENARRKQTTSPPNLFAGPDGTLKQPRRGRPQPSKSLPTNVDINSISTPSEPIKRTDSPSLLGNDAQTPVSAATPSPVNPPPRSSSTSVSGFDDDAWTNRPSSTKPTPPAAAAPAPSATAPSNPPPAPTPPPAPASVPPAPAAPPAPTPPADSGAKSLAKTTEADVFEQLARLGELRTRNPGATSSPAPQAVPSPVLSPPLRSLSQGLGVGSSPVPMGQHIQTQQTGFMPQAAPSILPQQTGFTPQATPSILPQPTGFAPQPNPSILPQQTGFAPSPAPRGPFAPVPANQGLLQPLVPTTTGFNGFVPTRPMSTPAAPGAFQPSFLSSQPTGFAGSMQQPLMSQPTGFPATSNTLLPQTTGFPVGVTSPFGSGSQYNPNGFGNTQIGMTTGLGQLPSFNSAASPPPVPPLPSMTPNSNNNNTSPANIFAQMKSGNFGTDTAPQSADKYDALRPNPLAAQPTGWGYQSNGFQGGYGYQG